MKLTISKQSDYKRHWKKALCSLPVDWLYLSAYHNKEYNSLQLAGVHNPGICDYNLYSTSTILWESCKSIMRKKEILCARIRLVPAIESFDKYTGLEAGVQESWNIPFEYRSIEIKSNSTDIPNVVSLIFEPNVSYVHFSDGKVRKIKISDKSL